MEASDERVKVLKAKGADSILVFRTDRHYPYVDKSRDSLSCLPAHYLFWIQEGKVFSQKIEPCHILENFSEKLLQSPVIYPESDSIYDFLAQQFDSIGSIRVGPFIYKKVDKGREYYDIGWRFHYIVHNLTMHIGDTVIYQSVNPDDCSEYFGYSTWKNLNYAHNQSAPVWQFIQIINRQIEELEEKKAYITK